MGPAVGSSVRGRHARTLSRLRGLPPPPRGLRGAGVYSDGTVAPSVCSGSDSAQLVGISSDLEFCHPANTS